MKALRGPLIYKGANFIAVILTDYLLKSALFIENIIPNHQIIDIHRLYAADMVIVKAKQPSALFQLARTK